MSHYILVLPIFSSGECTNTTDNSTCRSGNNIMTKITHVESIAIENCVLLQKYILIVDKILPDTVYPSTNKGWSLNSNMKAVAFTCCFGADENSDYEHGIIIIVNDCED